MQDLKKVYVLDTNVLVHDPLALYAFHKGNVALPIEVLEELDRFKSENSDRGRNARDVIRRLDQLRERAPLSQGVTLDHGGSLHIVYRPTEYETGGVLKTGFADDAILAVALYLKNKGHEVHFISKDINARVKADVLGIIAEDYLKGRVTPDEFYKGWTAVSVPSIELKKENPPLLRDLEPDLVVNQFVWLTSSGNEYNYRVFRYLGAGNFKPVADPAFQWPLEARNPEQRMAIDLLLDKDIKLVCLVGPAGTGKTFLALLAGLHQILMQDAYQKMLVARPVVPLGPDIGYLPGDIHEKLHSWMKPIYDNMEFISHAAVRGRHLNNVAYEAGRKRKKKFNGGSGGHFLPMDQLIKENKLSLEAITYMRGRSIPYQFVFIDEVQNLSPHEIKTIITRVGEGSKIVLSGDPYQIDSPYLDFSSNGLVVVANKFKGQSIFGSVYLDISERSELSRLAGELL